MAYARGFHALTLVLSACSVPDGGTAGGDSATPSDSPSVGVGPDTSDSGTAVESSPTARLSVSPISYDFGAVKLGSTHEVAVVIANFGDADLHVVSLVYLMSDSDDLSRDEIATPFVVAPGNDAEVWIRYTPTDEADDFGVLTIESDDPSTPIVHAEQRGSVLPTPD